MIERINFFYDTLRLQQYKTPQDVAKGFESILLSFLMKEMAKSIPISSSFSYGFYFDMFMMQMAQVISDSGKTGLSSYISKAIESYQQNQIQRGDVGEVNPISGEGK